MNWGPNPAHCLFLYSCELRTALPLLTCWNKNQKKNNIWEHMKIIGNSISVSINKVLLAHSSARLFIVYGRWCTTKGWVLPKSPCGPQGPNIDSLAFLQKRRKTWSRWRSNISPSHVSLKEQPSRCHSTCKGPEVGSRLMCSWQDKGLIVTGAEWMRSESTGPHHVQSTVRTLSPGLSDMGATAVLW